MADKKPSVEQQKAEKEILLFKKVFSGPDGDLVLKSLMAEFHMLNGTFSDSPYNMYFREGERNVVKTIIAKLDMDMVQFKKLYTDTQDEYSMEGA